MPRVLYLCPPLLALALSACGSTNQSTTARSATEQMLLSTAAERAAERLDLKLPSGTLAYVDTTEFDAIDGKYAIGAIEDKLLRQGIRLTGDAKAADTIIALRSGALAIDERTSLVGLPAMNLPIPLAGQLGTPEVALYKDATQLGVAKFAATAYDARQGGLQGTTGPQYGYAHNTQYVVMLFFAWDSNDLIPSQQRGDYGDLVGWVREHGQADTSNDE